MQERISFTSFILLLTFIIFFVSYPLAQVIIQGVYQFTGAIAATGSVTAATFISSGSGLTVANVGANSCGTTAATIVGNSNAAVITVGSVSGTQCRIAFPVAATTEYDCAANDETTAIALRVSPVDSTHTDILGALVAADKISVVCFAR
jgi:hypothetical protein